MNMRTLYFLSAVLLAVSCSSSRIPVAQETEMVNVGYGSLERKEVSSSVAQVNSKDVPDAAMTNIYDFLAGRVPGLEVNGNSLSIRGANSFYGSTAPLILVDGSPVDSVDDINPREVESVSVIKDGSAAMYGSRGANGVILIQMKRR